MGQIALDVGIDIGCKISMNNQPILLPQVGSVHCRLDFSSARHMRVDHWWLILTNSTTLSLQQSDSTCAIIHRPHCKSPYFLCDIVAIINWLFFLSSSLSLFSKFSHAMLWFTQSCCDAPLHLKGCNLASWSRTIQQIHARISTQCLWQFLSLSLLSQSFYTHLVFILSERILSLCRTNATNDAQPKTSLVLCCLSSKIKHMI